MPAPLVAAPLLKAFIPWAAAGLGLSVGGVGTYYLGKTVNNAVTVASAAIILYYLWRKN